MLQFYFKAPTLLSPANGRREGVYRTPLMVDNEGSPFLYPLTAPCSIASKKCRRSAKNSSMTGAMIKTQAAVQT